MIRSFLNLYGMNSSIDAAHIATMRLNLPASKYGKPDDKIQFVDRVMPRLRSIPGVERVAIADSLPLQGSASVKIEVEGDAPVNADSAPMTDALRVTPDYFNVIGLPIREGRGMTANDGRVGAEAIIVNQSFASRFYPKGSAIGRRVRVVNPDKPQPWLTIIGVARNFKQGDPMKVEIDPLMYQPYQQNTTGNFFVIAKSAVPPDALPPAFRQEFRAVDQDLPISQVMSLQKAFEQQRWPFRVFGSLFAGFSIFALLLASIGIYSVMAYSVSQRTREIGIRVALGADRGSVMRLILMRGIYQLIIALAIGLVGALAATRVLQGVLVQVSATDPVTFAALAALLSAVTLVACLIPARRALRVDPVIALRYD